MIQPLLRRRFEECCEDGQLKVEFVKPQCECLGRDRWDELIGGAEVAPAITVRRRLAEDASCQPNRIDD